MSIGTGAEIFGTGETYYARFKTINTVGAMVNADSTPTGVLVVNGADTGVTVTITNPTTGRYNVSCSLAGRTVGDVCWVRITATVGGVTQEGGLPGFRIAFAAALTSSIITSGTGTDQVSVTSGRVDVGKIAGTAQTARDLGAGVLVGDKTGFSLAAPDSRVIDSGTAQAGSTSTTIKFAAGASAASGIYNGEVVFVYGGTGAKQTRTITAYNGTTKVATVDRAWQTTPDNTSLYAVLSVIAAPMNAALQVESSTDELLAIKSNNSRPPAGWPSQFTASLDNGTDTFTNEVFTWCADIDATMGTGTWAIGSFPVIKAPGYVQQSAIGTAYGVIGLIVGDRVYFFLNDAGDWNGEDYKGWHWDGTTLTDGVTISSEPNYFATWTTVGTVTASFSNFVVYNPVRALTDTGATIPSVILKTPGQPIETNLAGAVTTANPSTIGNSDFNIRDAST